MGKLPIIQTITVDIFSCDCYILESMEKITLTERYQKSLITVISIEKVKGCVSKGTDM